MMDRHEERGPGPSVRGEGLAVPAEHTYARHIDCCESPRSRERSGGGRGLGSLDAEAYAARSRRTGAH